MSAKGVATLFSFAALVAGGVLAVVFAPEGEKSTEDLHREISLKLEELEKSTLAS